MNTGFKVAFIRLFIFIGVLLSANFAHAEGVRVGIAAPYFKVVSGNGEELTLDDIKAKAAVIFYETKDTAQRNRKLKDELNKFYDAQPDDVRKMILRVPVINCNGVFFTGAWKGNLRESSKKEGITIYGDWDGKMFFSYGIKDKESNLIIIGTNGVVRYSFAGQVAEKDFGRIKDLLAAEANPGLVDVLSN